VKPSASGCQVSWYFFWPVAEVVASVRPWNERSMLMIP
jgi:hypothetical protein